MPEVKQPTSIPVVQVRTVSREKRRPMSDQQLLYNIHLLRIH